jgi:antitoxin component of MazEF toxin-antitoxin module
MGLEEEAKSEEAMETSLTFKDAKNIEKKHAWATGYLALAMEKELVADVNDNFKPEKPADRLWVAKLLVNALGLESEAQAKMNVELDFKDSNEISAEYIGYVAVAVEKKIVQGYTNNTFRPNKPVTRAELAAFLDRTGEHLPEFNDGATRGTVTAEVYGNKLLIVKGNQTTELILDPDAFIYRDGVKITSSELEIGDEVKIRSYNDVVIFIEVTKKAEEETTTVNANYTGTLNAAVSSNKLSIEKEDETNVEFELADNAVIYRAGVLANATALKAGDEVFVTVHNSEIVLVQVTKTVEETDFTAVGLFKSMTLNAQGEISTITIIKTNTNGGTQESIYNVSEDVEITGDFTLLVLNNPIELQGESQLVTSIEIK